MRRQDAGFTLLEILVALVVFGLMMAGLARTFDFGMKAWSEETRISTRPGGMLAVTDALRRMIAAARPGSFEGQSDGFTFTTKLPSGAGLGDRLADVAIRVLPGHRLVLRFVPHPPGVRLGPMPKPRIELLVRNVASLHAAYLVPRRGASPAWSDRWTGNGLPLLVRLHLDFTNDRSWPDLVVAPVDTRDE